MGCTSSSSPSKCPIESIDIPLEENCLLFCAPILKRSRNYQWYWNSRKDQEEQWNKYSDIENEIIEDEYQEKRNKQIELDGNYILDLENLFQYKKKDLNNQFRIQRIELDQNRTNLCLRKERFTIPVMLINPSISSDDHREPLPKQYWKLELENQIKTMTNLVEDAALGIVKEGKRLNKEYQGQWIAKQLLQIKHSGEYIKAQHSRVPKDIGQTCLYLYTKESFWYKSIHNFLRQPEIVNQEQLKIFGPFCHLMHWYLKSNFQRNNIQIIYRSLNLSDEQRMIFTKSHIQFTSFTSCTRKLENTKSFGNTILIIQTKTDDQLNNIEDDTFCGADISHFSDFPDEEEFLICPGSHFRFLKEEYDQINDKYLIYIQSLQNHFI